MKYTVCALAAALSCCWAYADPVEVRPTTSAGLRGHAWVSVQVIMNFSEGGEWGWENVHDQGQVRLTPGDAIYHVVPSDA